jgi:hypothetical protein
VGTSTTHKCIRPPRPVTWIASPFYLTHIFYKSFSLHLFSINTSSFLLSLASHIYVTGAMETEERGEIYVFPTRGTFRLSLALYDVFPQDSRNLNLCEVEWLASHWTLYLREYARLQVEQKEDFSADTVWMQWRSEKSLSLSGFVSWSPKLCTKT